MKLEDRIMKRIWADVTDRRGIKHEFECCDKEIQGEIRKAWRDIIREEVNKEQP